MKDKVENYLHQQVMRGKSIIVVDAALEHAPEHYPYFCGLMWAGLRPAEGFALTAEKIDLRGHSILVDAQIGQRGGFKTTKTGEERTVDLSAKLADVLGQAMARRRAEAPKVVSIAGGPQAKEDGRPLGPWLCYPDLGPVPGEKDAQRVYKRALAGMRRALEQAGLPTYFSLHSLRHTFGSGLIVAGYSPATSSSRWAIRASSRPSTRTEAGSQ